MTEARLNILSGIVLSIAGTVFLLCMQLQDKIDWPWYLLTIPLWMPLVPVAAMLLVVFTAAVFRRFK